jgi:hypothetical protein
VANALAYYDTATITAVISFIVQAQGKIEKEEIVNRQPDGSVCSGKERTPH